MKISTMRRPIAHPRMRRHARPAMLLIWAIAASVLCGTVAAQRSGDSVQTILARAVADFRAGRVAESVTGFDRLVRLAPDAAPDLWQRGIALYYAGRYRDCRAQFESHRTVNPADVENAAWHFLCVARAESPQRARAALLPVGPDSRRPMSEVYRMFKGEVSPEAVLAAAGQEPLAQFYAALYVGLYDEANGDARARVYIADAADERFARVAGYMHDVAKVHMKVRGWTAPSP